jgi:DNA repair exonuclease SbcCD ATPase subunit
LEDERKILKAKQKEINKELERIPVRIDEVTQGRPDISNIQPEKIAPEIKRLRQQKQEKETELVRLQSGGEIAEKTKKLREVEAELLEMKNKHWERNEKEIQETHQKLQIEMDKRLKMQQAIANQKAQIDTNSRIVEGLEADIEKLRKDWRDTDSLTFVFEQNDTCPTCGQRLPEERLQEAREKALANFNQEKAAKLERITKNGKRLKDDVEKLQKDTDARKDMIEKLQKDVLPLEESIKELQEKIKVLQTQRTDISENQEYQDNLKEKLALEKEIVAIRGDIKSAAMKIEVAIDALEDDIGSLEYSLAQVEQHKKGQQRIEELKAQEKKLATEYERVQKELFLLEEFMKTKVTLLEEKINSRFKLAKFKLFNVLVNGGIEECCETTYQGVPYSTALNNGMRKNIGLDIINTLSEHYGFVAPIFFDNREAVTQLIPAKGQLISLVVSEKDKKLRVEHEEVRI